MKHSLLVLSFSIAILLAGCSNDIIVIDTDWDGTQDLDDGCPFDPLKIIPGTCGCGYVESVNRSIVPYTMSCRDNNLADSDGDGVPDIFDQCPNDSLKFEPGECGCGSYDYKNTQNELECKPSVDTDGDGTPDIIDECPLNKFKVYKGECGCDEFEIRDSNTLIMCKPSPDTDGDGFPDVYDDCPLNPKVSTITEPCTCDEVPFIDEDNSLKCLVYTDIVAKCPNDADCDGIEDDSDACPYNPNIYDSKDVSDEYGCADYDVSNGDYTIYTAKDLMKVLRVSASAAPIPRAQTKTQIHIASDINLADILTPEEISWDAPFECSSLGENAFFGSLNNTILTSDDKNVARKVTFTAKNLYGKDVRCKFNHALFDTVTESEISHLLLDFDLDGKEVRASLAHDVVGSRIEDVAFSGTIASSYCSHENHYDECFYCLMESCTGNESNFHPFGGLVATITGSEILNSGCLNASIEFYETPFVGGLAGLVADTAIKNDAFDHRIKYFSAFTNSAPVAWRIKDSTIDGFTNTVKSMRIDYSEKIAGLQNAGFAVDAQNVEFHNIKNDIYGVNNEFSIPLVAFSGFVMNLINGNVTNLDNRIRSFYDHSWTDRVIKFSGAFMNVEARNESTIKLKNIINRIQIDGAYEIGEYYGFLDSSYVIGRSNRIEITNLYNVFNYHSSSFSQVQSNVSAVFNEPSSDVLLNNIYSIGTIYQGYNIGQWYRNMLFGNIISADSRFNDGNKDIYYLIPSSVVPDEVGVGIGTEADTEDFLSEFPPFDQSRVSESESDTNRIISKLNANDANKEDGVTWGPIEERYLGDTENETTYTVPGFILKK